MRRPKYFGSSRKLSRVAVGMLALFVAVQVLPPFFGLHSPFGLATGLQEQNDPSACEAFGPNWTNCQDAFSTNDAYAYANDTLPPAIIAHDATNSGGITTGTQLDITHTIAGTNRLVLVGVHQANTFPAISSVVWDPTGVNEALTQVAQIAQGADVRTTLYRLLSPTAKTADMRITIASTDQLFAGVSSYTGVHQTAPLGTPATNNGIGGTVSVTASGVGADDLVFDAAGTKETGSPAVGADQTERWNGNAGGQPFGFGSTQPGTAGGVMTWSGVTEEWATIGVAIKPAGDVSAIVVDGGFADATAFEGERHIFLNPRGQGALYAFYTKEVAGPTTWQIRASISTDGGVSWTEDATVIHSNTAEKSRVSVAFREDGGNSRLLVYTVTTRFNGGDSGWTFRRAVIDDAGTGFTWSASSFFDYGDPVLDAVIGVAPDNYVHILWKERNRGTNRVIQLQSSTVTDPTVFGDFSGEVQVSVGGFLTHANAPQFLALASLPSGGNEMVAFYPKTSTTFAGRAWTWTGASRTFDTEQSFTTGAFPHSFSAVAGSATDIVHLLYSDGQNLLHKRWDVTGAFPASTTVKDAGGGETYTSVTIGKDTSGTPEKLRVAYAHTPDTSILRKKTSDEDVISFSAESTITDETNNADFLSLSQSDGGDSHLIHTDQANFDVIYHLITENPPAGGGGSPGKNDTAWRDFGFAINPSATITSVEIGLEWFRTSSEPILNVTVSWDGGTSWATNQTASNKSADDDAVEFLDFTAATAWTPAKLNDANLRVRVGTNASDARLDYVTVRVNSNVAPSISNFRIQQTGTVQTQRDPTACEAVGDNWTNCQDAFSSNDLYAYANGSVGGGDPITFIDWTEQSISGTSLTVTVPTHVDGDTLITVLVHSDDAPAVTITPPAGWNLVRDKTNMGTLAVSPPVLYIYERQASSEPASYIWSWDLTGGLLGVMLSYRGTDAASPIGQNAVNAQTGTGTDAVAPSVTTTNDNELALWIGWSDDDDANDPSATLSRGTVRAREMTAAGGNGAFVGIGDENIPSPGATGTATWTLTAIEERSGVTITLLPTAGAGGNDTAWKDFGFALGGADGITTVEIGLEWFRNNTAPVLSVTISWDGGATWATIQTATNKSADDDTVEFLDFTSATTWTASKLNDTNLRARASTNASGGRLDYTTVRVTSLPSRAGTQLDVDTEYEYLFNVTDADGWSDIATDGNVSLNLWYDGNGTPTTDQRNPTACTAIGNDWTNCQDAFSSNDVYAYANDSAGGGGSASFNYFDPIEVTPGTASAWTEVDASPYIPVGATGVILHITTTGGEAYGVRKNGSMDDRVRYGFGAQHNWAMIGVDANRTFEANIASTTNVDIWLLGYTGSGVTFFTDAPDKSLGTTGSWLDIDISGDTGADTAIGAIIEYLDVTGNGDFGLRMNGSSDNRVLRQLAHPWAIIGVDANEILEGNITDLGDDFFLVGYVTEGAVFNLNADDVSIGSINTYVDIDISGLTSSKANGAFIEVINANPGPGRDFALRKNGSAEDIFKEIHEHTWGFVEVDSNEILEGKIDSTDVDFYLVGYSLAGSAASLLIDVTSTSAATAPATWANVPDLNAMANVAGPGSVLILSFAMQQTLAADQTAEYRFAVDGIRDGPHLLQFNDAVNEGTGLSMLFAVTGLSAGSHTFSVQWQDVAGTPTADTSRTRSFQVMEIPSGASILVDVKSTTSGSAPASWADVPDLTGSPTVAGPNSVVLLLAGVQQGGSDNAADYQVNVDGTREGPQLTQFIDNVATGTGLSIAYARTGLAAGSHTFSLQWQLHQNSPTLDTGRTRTFQVVEMTNANLLVDVVSTSSGTAPGTWADVPDLTGSPTLQDADSVSLLLANIQIASPDTTDRSADFRLAVDGTREGGQIVAFQDWVDGRVGPMMLPWFRTGLSGTQTFSAQWQNLQSSPTLETSMNRSFQVLEFTGAGSGGNDFKVQRGQVNITTSQSTVTITAGTDYVAPASLSRAFIRIVGTRLSGNGDDTGLGAGTPAREWMTSISNPGNLLTSITFERYFASTTDTTRIYWQILEYTGPSGGANEFIVRDQADIEQTTGASLDGASATATDDADVVVFITGQRADGAAQGDTDRGLYTAEWVAASDLPRFTRGDGTGTASVSYGVVEFTGSNWKVQRAEHTYVASASEETETITAVNSLARTFIHAQMRTASGNVDEMGQRARLASTTTVGFQLKSGAGIFSQVGVAWVVENTQVGSSAMNVQRVSGSRTGGLGNPDEWTEAITAVADLSATSIMGETSDMLGTGDSAPRGATGLDLTDTTTVTLWRNDGSGGKTDYRLEVVEWPTAPDAGGGGGPGKNDTAWRDFGYVLSGSITQVEVGIEWWRNNTAPILNVTVSWDGGSTWATNQTATNKSADDNTVEWLDFTSATAWTPTKLNDANFRVRAGTNASGARLDYVTARVTSSIGGELTFNQQTTGANYRIELKYIDTADPTTASLSEWSVTEGRATYNASASGLTAIMSGPTIIGYEFRLALKFGFQVKHAVAPTNSTVGAYNDLDSWNGEVVATDGSSTITLQEASTGEHLEFGVFMYTFVNISADWSVTVFHGQTANTNTVTVYRRSNDDFTLRIWFVTDLIKGGDTISITNVQILAAGDLTDDITADTAFVGLGEGNAVYILGSATLWFSHSTDTDEDTTTVQFSVTAPFGTPIGIYTAQLTIRIQQQP